MLVKIKKNKKKNLFDVAVWHCVASAIVSDVVLCLVTGHKVC